MLLLQIYSRLTRGDRTKIYFPLYQIIFLYESLNILGGSKNNVNGVELELSNLTDEDRQDQFKMDMFIEAIDMGTDGQTRPGQPARHRQPAAGRDKDRGSQTQIVELRSLH